MEKLWLEAIIGSCKDEGVKTEGYYNEDYVC